MRELAKHSRTIFYEVLYCTAWNEIKSADEDCLMATAAKPTKALKKPISQSSKCLLL
jgi:hypothetical protein